MTHTIEGLSVGDRAFKLFDDNREELGDRFQVEYLDVEFPYIAEDLRREFGAHSIYLARADENEAGTFKTRGAIVGASTLKEQGFERIRLASAGSHARASAVAARILGMWANIGVPESAPYAKKEGLYELLEAPQLDVQPVGKFFHQTLAWIENSPELGELLHPYDNPHVIAGQGTLADDILAALPETEIIVTPTGGGGLTAGILNRLKEMGRSDILINAVEAPGNNSLSLSLEAESITEVDHPNSEYGGSAVRAIGGHAFKTFLEAGDCLYVTQVTESDVEYVTSSYQQSRIDRHLMHLPPYEPTALVAVAGLYAIAQQFPDKNIVLIGTGHNAPLPTYV